MVKHSRARTTRLGKKRKSSKDWLIVLPILALLIKFVIMANTQGGGWLGADGENYLTGVDGLLKDGLFSKEGKLVYWPAGYPIFIWPLAAISLSKFIYLLGIIQSLLFAFGTYIFTKELSQTKVSLLAVPTSVFISFNPTLSLSTLAIGYEAPIAALLLVAAAYLLRDINPLKTSALSKNIYGVGISLTIASFFQPRILLFAFIYVAFWSYKKSATRHKIQVAAATLIIVMSLPTLLIVRNVIANNQAVISTNLGNTMRIGAGDKATGGYATPNGSIPCTPAIKGQNVTDNQMVVCILRWYIANPGKTAKLAFNKTLFYWSPWFGPEANGTMARNPWLKISPLVGIAKNQDGNNLIFGGIGKTISWAWLLCGLVLVVAGLYWLWILGGVERNLFWLAGIPTILGWLTSLATIGDHRFRLPQMGLSLFIQIAGLYAIRSRFKRPV